MQSIDIVVRPLSFVFDYFFAFSPLFLVLWLLPWFVICIWIDNGWPRRFTISSMLMGVAVCSFEMAAMAWLGPALIAPGIIIAGIAVFLPTLAIRLLKQLSSEPKILPRDVAVMAELADNGSSNGSNIL